MVPRFRHYICSVVCMLAVLSDTGQRGVCAKVALGRPCVYLCDTPEPLPKRARKGHCPVSERYTQAYILLMYGLAFFIGFNGRDRLSPCAMLNLLDTMKVPSGFNQENSTGT